MKNDQELSARLDQLKSSIQEIWAKITKNDFEINRSNDIQASAEEREGITTATKGIDSFGDEDKEVPEEDLIQKNH